MKQFQGVFPALLTPFREDGHIHEAALQQVVRYNLEKGVTGFYVCGSTGEAFLLSQEERIRTYQIVKQQTGDSCTLIAHIGCIGTAHAVELGRAAQQLGYDAVSSVTPFYYGFTTDEIKQYYFDIADAVDLPMLVYNIPSKSGVTMRVQDLSELLCDSRMLGVKYTSNDFFALEQVKTAHPDKLVYNGHDEMFLAGLAMGADGGIGSTYNFMAEKFIQMRALFMDGKNKEAYDIQKTVNKIIALLFKVGVIQGTKEILNQLGIEVGACRAPFKALSDDKKMFIKKEIMPLL